jgi:glycosyl transferase family 25
MKLGIYVINLDPSPDRLRVVADCMRRASLPFTRIEAVDGRALDMSQPDDFAVAARVREWPDLLTPNAIACTLSHHRAFERILPDGVDVGLVLEDDVLLSPAIAALLPELARAANETDVYLVYFHNNNANYVIQFSSQGAIPLAGGATLYPVVTPWPAYSSGGYLLHKQVARKLRDYVFPVHLTADSWGCFYRDGAIGGLWGLLPPPAYTASEVGYSGVGERMRRLEKRFPNSIQSIVRRVRERIRPVNQA